MIQTYPLAMGQEDALAHAEAQEAGALLREEPVNTPPMEGILRATVLHVGHATMGVSEIL